MRVALAMIKRKDDGKVADSMRQAAQCKDMRQYIADGQPLFLPDGELFHDLLKRLDEAEIAQGAS